MKSDIAIHLPGMERAPALTGSATTVRRRQNTHKLVSGILGITAEVLFSLGLILVGFLISMIFGR